MQTLHGTTALLVGGAGGIGRASARLLLADGAHVTIASRSAERLERETERLAPIASEAGGTIRWTVCDSLDEEQVRAAVEVAAAPTGRLDAAVAIAGGGPLAPVLRYDVETLEDTFRRNISSFYLVLKHAGSAMVASGGGSVVAVSSMQAVQAAPMFSAYCAAKAGLEMLVRCAAEELGEHRVRVNAVRPGLTRTDATVGMFGDEGVMEAYMAQQPLDRPGEAEDVAGAIRYFCGPESSWTTGQCLAVDGGTMLRRFPDLTEWYRARLGDDRVRPTD
ncbi:MAG: SDR family oxidoreductase [Acidimicrobiia bacterium]|jgi:NAD(P)-dependent dehydrogenase (short-subunit alcohol dehydrogenase family)